MNKLSKKVKPERLDAEKSFERISADLQVVVSTANLIYSERFDLGELCMNVRTNRDERLN